MRLIRSLRLIERDLGDNFRQWFGNSVIRNPDGSPKVMYHGTGAKTNFASFKQSPRGIFFTDDPEYAGHYATMNGEDGSRIIPAYLRVVNPYVMTPEDIAANRQADMKGFRQLRMFQTTLFARARAAGHDGMEYAGAWVVFDPRQIKSTMNRGTFDNTAKFGESEERIGEIATMDLKDRTVQVTPENKEEMWKIAYGDDDNAIVAIYNGRRRQLLKPIKVEESYHTTFKNYGNDVEVYHNPNKQELMKMLRNSRFGILRIWLVSSGLYCWDGYLSTHDVDFDLNHDGYTSSHSGMIDKNGVVVNHPEMYDNDIESAIAAFQHPSLIKLFGNPVPVRFEELHNSL